jgi:rhamnose transport system permease protein
VIREVWRRWNWECILVLLIVLAGAWSSLLSSYYLSSDQLLESTRQFIIPGLLAIGLVAIVIAGEIDISLGSILAVGAVVFSKCSAVGLSLSLATPIVLVVCAALGGLNGVAVARFGLPSLAVTLGAMGAYRGLAFILAGGNAYQGYADFDDSYLYVGSENFAQIIPVSLCLFLALVALAAFLVHRTTFGRSCYAAGGNQTAAWISGVDVTVIKVLAYAFAAALAGVGALVWIGQYGSARGDNADGMILFVLTAVVLGGVDIRGGRGTVLGVLLSLVLLGTLRNGMGLANIGGPVQSVVLGALLILGILRPSVTRLIRLLAMRAEPTTS